MDAVRTQNLTRPPTCRLNHQPFVKVYREASAPLKNANALNTMKQSCPEHQRSLNSCKDIMEKASPLLDSDFGSALGINSTAPASEEPGAGRD